ncbi:MAG: NINE protein, partial [Planctomycetaceae bacterium]|nr:NINE protein [Planctomycetaceae bacterium]
MYCVNCGKEISDKAAVCVGCGVPVKDADRRSQITAGLLALLLGGWGAHKFYHGHFIIGILYALSALLGWGTIGVLSVAAGDSPSQR